MNPTEITACIKQAIYDYSEAINQIENTDMELEDIKMYLFEQKLQYGLCAYFKLKFEIITAKYLIYFFFGGWRGYIFSPPIVCTTKAKIIEALQSRKNFLNKYLL